MIALKHSDVRVLVAANRALAAACDYPFTPEGQASYLSDLVRLLKRYDNVTGVYYWYPEETYVEPFYGRIDLHRGMFDEYTGEVLPAINQLKDFLQ